MCTEILEVFKYKIVMNIRPVLDQLLQMDRRTNGWTDTTNKANSRFSLPCECV